MSNSESEVIGKMRLMNTVASATRNLIKEFYEEGDEMISPAKALEMANIMEEVNASLIEIHPIVQEFVKMAESRKPKV